MRVTRAASTTATALALACLSAPAAAEERDPEVRLWSDAEGSLRWYYGWSTAFALTTAGQIALAYDADDRATRARWIVGASTSGLGLLTTVALPPTSAFALPRLRAMPNGTPEEQARRRASAREALERAAGEQRLGTSWLAHAGGVVVNLAAGLILWRGYGELGRGAVGFVVGTAVSEIKIATQPTSLVDVGIAPAGAGIVVRGVF